MKRFFITILIINLLKVNAQSVDSLLLVSYDLKTDSERVNLFYDEGFKYRAADPQYSYNCAKQAEQLAQKVSVPKFTAKANVLLGILYYRKSDFITALSYHKKALNIYTIINHQRGIAVCETNLGNLYSDLKRYNLAQEAYLKALEINNQLNKQQEVGTCLLNLGVLNAEIGSAQKDSACVFVAKKYFDKAQENAKARNDYELEAECLNNLAVVNTILKKYDDAIANCINSIKVKNIMDNEMEMADSYLNLAVVYLKTNDVKQCIQNISIADSIINKYEYLNAKIQSLKLKTELNEKVRNFELAYGFSVEHQKLKDSLEKVNKDLNLENNFIEEYNLIVSQKNDEEKFPFIFFNFLIILAVLIIGFVFKFKR